MRLTSVTIEVTCCQVVVPNLVRVKTEDAIRSGAVGIRDLEARQSISSSNIDAQDLPRIALGGRCHARTRQKGSGTKQNYQSIDVYCR